MSDRKAGFNIKDPAIVASLAIGGTLGLVALASKIAEGMKPSPEEALQYARQFKEAGMDKEAAVMMQVAQEGGM